MSDESSMANGIGEAMYAIEPAWHGKGVVVDHAPNSEEAIRLAHLDWQVEQKPVYAFDQAANRAIEVPGRVANVRNDNGTVLGVVSSRYRPFQNWEAFKFCDQLLQNGIVTYESAGALKDGRIVWLLCRLSDVSSEVAEGDQVDGYGLFYIGHDGTRAATFMPTGVRVVCWNTFSVAEMQGLDSGRMLRIRHTKNLDKQVEQAREMLGLANKQFNAYVAASRMLATRKIDDSAFHAYVDEIVPPPLTGPMPPHRERIRNLIDELYFTDPRQNLPSIGRTAWAAVNAVTHFVDHAMKAKGKTPEQKLSNTLYSVWLGRGNQIKQKAMSTALAMFT